MTGANGYGQSMGRGTNSDQANGRGALQLLFGPRTLTEPREYGPGGTFHIRSERAIGDFHQGKITPLIKLLANHAQVPPYDQHALDRLVVTVREGLLSTIDAENHEQLSAQLVPDVWRLVDRILTHDTDCRLLDDLARQLVQVTMVSADQVQLKTLVKTLAAHRDASNQWIEEALTAFSQPAPNSVAMQAQWELLEADPFAPPVYDLGEQLAKQLSYGHCRLQAEQLVNLYADEELHYWQLSLENWICEPRREIPAGIQELLADQRVAETAALDRLRTRLTDRVFGYQLPAEQAATLRDELLGLGINEKVFDKKLATFTIEAEIRRRNMIVKLSHGNPIGETYYDQATIESAVSMMCELMAEVQLDNQVFAHFVGQKNWARVEAKYLARPFRQPQPLARELQHYHWRFFWEARLSWDAQLHKLSINNVSKQLTEMVKNIN